MLENRVSQEIEDAIVALALEEPAFGQLRVANELRKRGLVSPAGVRWVWLRHDLEARKKRLKALSQRLDQGQFLIGQVLIGNADLGISTDRRWAGR